MGLLADKNIMIEPPKVSIKNTMAVEKFRERYPVHFRKLDNCVREWIHKNIVDIYRAVEHIQMRPFGWMTNDKEPLITHLPESINTNDIAKRIEYIFKDLVVDPYGNSLRNYIGIYSIIYFYKRENMIRMELNYTYSDTCSNKIPRKYHIYIKF